MVCDILPFIARLYHTAIFGPCFEDRVVRSIKNPQKVEFPDLCEKYWEFNILKTMFDTTESTVLFIIFWVTTVNHSGFLFSSVNIPQ